MKNIEKEVCICKSTKGLFISRRQVSLVTAFLIIFLVLTFTFGYFLGRRQAIFKVTDKLEHQTFKDYSDSKIKSLYSENPNSKDSNTKIDRHYYAKLVSFHSIKYAQQFVNRVQKMGYNVYIKSLKSNTANGKLVTWYQVTTDKYSDINKLKKIVSHIKEIEKLHDIKIISA